MVRHAASNHRGDPESHDPVALLENSVETLYSVFSGYPLRSHIEGCPCCVGEEDQAQLHTRSLRELSEDDLSTYASKAMTTWGDDRDFRHFLPRLLELMTGRPYDTFYPGYILPKLAYAGWGDWPEQEQAAIESFLWLRWTVGLEVGPREFDAEEWLYGVACTGIDTAAYIAAWKGSTAPTAFAHLAYVLTHNPDLPAGGTVALFDPDEAPVPELREWLNACLADAEFQARLADWYQGDGYSAR